MKVLFNRVNEFCMELKKDSPKIDRSIVRATVRYKISTISPNIQHVFAMATYSVEGQVVELDHYCGDIWGINDTADQKVLDIAKAHLLKVEDTVKTFGCEIRSGHLEE